MRGRSGEEANALELLLALRPVSDLFTFGRPWHIYCKSHLFHSTRPRQAQRYPRHIHTNAAATCGSRLARTLHARSQCPLNRHQGEHSSTFAIPVRSRRSPLFSSLNVLYSFSCLLCTSFRFHM